MGLRLSSRWLVQAGLVEMSRFAKRFGFDAANVAETIGCRVAATLERPPPMTSAQIIRRQADPNRRTRSIRGRESGAAAREVTLADD